MWKVVRLEVDERSKGVTLVSGITQRTMSIGTDSSSAAICASTVCQRRFQDARQATAAPRAGRRGALERGLVPDAGGHALEALAHAHPVHTLAGDAHVALTEDVLAPQREWAHAELARDAVQLLLARPRHLRDAEAPEAAAGLPVRVDEVAIDARVRDAIRAERAVARVAHDDGAHVGVRPLLPVDRRLPRHQRAVLLHARLDGRARGQPPRAAQELVLAVEEDAHVPVRNLHGEQRRRRVDGA
jgi:hypothetical protein